MAEIVVLFLAILRYVARTGRLRVLCSNNNYYYIAVEKYAVEKSHRNSPRWSQINTTYNIIRRTAVFAELLKQKHVPVVSNESNDRRYRKRIVILISIYTAVK